MRRTPFLFAALLPVVASLAVAGPLADAPSAFVRAHTNSPVQFMPWGEAAFARAKAENKPVYVHVGAFTQELARAMREQSFAREENATMMNEALVCVIVDRDERPDVAAFLQAYVNTVKQMQGWPLNVWLTPELKPFEGATYLPPSDEWGKEGFPNALRRVVTAWQTDAESQRAQEDEALAALAAAVPPAPAAVDAAAVTAILDEGAAAWLATYDAEHGGFGDTPRRLEPELLRFLLQRDDAAAREAATATLRRVALSPLRDPLDGGFFRSTGDPAWQQPTLQKTLADQARAVLAYLEADLRAPALGALEYACSLGSTKEGLAAAEDGTAEAIMPTFFWTAADVRGALGDDATRDVMEMLGMTEAGNVPPDAYLGIDLAGRNLPRWTAPAAGETLAAEREKLRAARASRPAPSRDNAASSGVHGLLLAALVRAGDTAAMADASVLAALIRTRLIAADGTLRGGPAFSTAAAPRDYAFVADGLLAFAAAAKDDPSHKAALALINKADELFWSTDAGRYMAAPAAPPPGIGVRVVPSAPDAGDLPSAESAMLLVLARHGVGESARRDALAAAIVAAVQESGTGARGDHLLALQAWLKPAPAR